MKDIHWTGYTTGHLRLSCFSCKRCHTQTHILMGGQYPRLHQKRDGSGVRVGTVHLHSAPMKPHTEYCIQAWGPQHKKDMELIVIGKGEWFETKREDLG